MSTLYGLTNDYLMLLDMADDPDIDEQTFIDTLEGLEGDIEVKAENYGKVIREFEAKQAACDAEIERLKKRKESYSNKVDTMKNTLKEAMKRMNKTKITGNLFAFTVKASQAKTVITGEVPEEYLRIKTEATPDKAAIKAAIEAGADISWAHLEKGDSLIIK